MTKIFVAGLAIALSIGGAYAQSSASYNSAKNAVTVHAGYSPGTIGAMDEASQGVATNPRDVAMQQDAQGEATGYSPGTVGANPGR